MKQNIKTENIKIGEIRGKVFHSNEKRRKNYIICASDGTVYDDLHLGTQLIFSRGHMRNKGHFGGPDL